MTFQQSTPTAKSAHYRAVAAALAMLVLLLSFASASPTLHSWLHVDSECDHHHEHDAPEHSDTSEQPDHHYCAVTLLDSGATVSIQIELPLVGNTLLSVLSVRDESIWYERPSLPQSARGPPTLIVV